MTDPVTGFAYPAAWVKRCTNAGRREVAAGRSVLTASGRVLRRGYTTGTTAAASCKAAVISLDRPLDRVALTLPCGLPAILPACASGGIATVVKDPGDYPGDATGGLAFVATAVRKDTGILFHAGEGIGRFARDTPRYRQGDPAVSPPAYASILRAIEEGMQECGFSGIEVTLSIPHGMEIGQRTLNPRIGVEGGISVLGSTGFVEPWDNHLAASALERVKAARQPVLTTGRLGMRFSHLRYPDGDIVLVGARIGEAIAAAEGRTVILCGLPALILRFIEPHILEGTGCATVEEFSRDPGFSAVVSRILADYRRRAPLVHVVLVDRDGTVVGESA
ncbi:MAG: cobalt-precorrin-5B (C(1))-methyltransferase [Methanomicrobiales archaeon]|nr:cobalt-precorrin-5B (C(1))-methyltransferase [Methanomicrobiales archaeon]